MMKIAQCIFIVDKLLLTFDVFMSFYPSFDKRRKFTIWMPTFCSVRWFLCGFLLHYSSTQAQKKGPTKKKSTIYILYSSWTFIVIILLLCDAHISQPLCIKIWISTRGCYFFFFYKIFYPDYVVWIFFSYRFFSNKNGNRKFFFSTIHSKIHRTIIFEQIFTYL